MKALLFAVLLLGLVACDSGNSGDSSEPPYKLPIETYRTLATYPAWSPDGRTIAFMTYWLPEGPDGSEVYGCRGGGIWLLDLETAKPRFLTCGWDTAWSPDGRSIAFTWERDVYVVDVATAEVRRLTNWDWSLWPSYSPDGQWIVFSSGGEKGAPPQTLYVMRADGSEPRRIGEEGVGEWVFPRWARDGTILHLRYVGPSGGPEVFRMNVDGSSAVQLTDEQRKNGDPVLSPDGRFIVWHASKESEDAYVWRMNADGSGKRKLARHAGWPDWSPDSQQIAYYCAEKDAEGNEYGTLCLMSANGRNQRVILRMEDFLPVKPSKVQTYD